MFPFSFFFNKETRNAVQTVKKVPAMQETLVQSLGQEDALKKEMVAHSSILAWEVPWTEEPGELQSMELQQVRNNLATKDTGSFWSKLS